MPNAIAPNAPCVEVCESPQTTVMPGMREAELRPDDVHDALLDVAERVQADAELLRVAAERLDLGAAREVGDRLVDVDRRGVVVLGRDREIGAAHRASLGAEAVEGLRAGDLVHEVQVDVDEVGRAVLALDLTRWSAQTFSARVFGAWSSAPVCGAGVVSVMHVLRRDRGEVSPASSGLRDEGAGGSDLVAAGKEEHAAKHGREITTVSRRHRDGVARQRTFSLRRLTTSAGTRAARSACTASASLTSRTASSGSAAAHRAALDAPHLGVPGGPGVEEHRHGLVHQHRLDLAGHGRDEAADVEVLAAVGADALVGQLRERDARRRSRAGPPDGAGSARRRAVR